LSIIARGRLLDLRSDRDDASVENPDIRTKRIGSRDNGTDTNGEIQLGHCASPVDPCPLLWTT